MTLAWPFLTQDLIPNFPLHPTTPSSSSSCSSFPSLSLALPPIREGAGGVSYMLMAGYPPAPLSDATQTLEEAGLKGASITQKLA